VKVVLYGGVEVLERLFGVFVVSVCVRIWLTRIIVSSTCE